MKAQDQPSANRKKPYQLQPVFVVLFETFFKSAKSVGSQFSQRFLDIARNKAGRPEVPIPMLAIVSTAVSLAIFILVPIVHDVPYWQIHAVLLAKKNKSGDDFKFTGNQFCDIYNFHVSLLGKIKQTAAAKFHKMMADIYEEIQ